MSNIADIAAGTAVVHIVADDKELDAALKVSKKSLENFSDACLKVGMRLLAACDLLIAPFARAYQL